MTFLPNRTPNLKNNMISSLVGDSTLDALAKEKLASQFYNSHSGVNNLSEYIDVNGTTVKADFEYIGNAANATNWLPASGGVVLPRVAVATPPTYNDGSPYHGGLLDDSVLFNESDYYQSAEAVIGDVTTEDIVVEIIFKARNGGTVANQRMIAKGDAVGWYIIQTEVGLVGFLMDTGPVLVGSNVACTPGTWNRLLVCVNRNEASANGARSYLNTVLADSDDFSTAAASLTNADSLTIGASSAGAVSLDSNVAYVAMWKAANLFSAGAAGAAEMAALDAYRHQQLTRTMPDFAKGTRAPTAATRAFSAYSEKLEPGRATSKLYLMGDSQIRVNSKLSKSGKYFEGVHIEPQVTNLAIQSGDASTTWVLLDAGDTFDLNSIDAANGETVMDGFIADATDGIHGITQNVTMTAVSTAISCYAKKGNQTFICIEDATIANGKAFFDIDNEVVGTSGAGIDALYIQPGKHNDTVRCIAIITGTAAAHMVSFKVATADNDDTFAGDGVAVNAYMWGFQVECNGLGYATSYIPTVLATATRLADGLTYAGGANIGGEDIGQGTIVADVLFDDYDLGASAYILTLSDGGAAADRIYSYIAAASDVLVGSTAATAGDAGLSIAVGDIVDGEIHSIRMRYRTDNLVIANNGVDDTTPDVACDIPNDIDTIHMGMSNGNISQPACLLRNIRIYSDPDVEV